MESPDNPDSNWAPQSPNLDNYYSADAEPVHPQHQGYRGSVSHSAPYLPPHSSSPLAQVKSTPIVFMPRGVRKQQQPETLPDASASEVLPTKRGRKSTANVEGNGAAAVVAEASTVHPGSETIEVKTKFPVARIKRIMQADDDVGKVAQVTPVVVSKALELFMISLVTKSAAEAKARSSKRVTAAHLKQAVEKDEQFDFLSEIVSKVADAPAASDKTDPDAMDVDGKKRKGAGRKKKKADDDDF
ncbi:histone-fold-containing protein [Delitschia confertaspora ATCC 74209]|uniref:NCT transcriptional regulatory complex subunit A n=1 Tax=Delitschia confertaspora ATCC 74209 TaxID=1513339 RepID=A0A9P4JEP1_9PLEO|nr:histone-fold-containing protein [Delitschia confertaspora ATCC 74209]